ncbi:MAG: bifunctional DNA-formamidopyrimidine glycosylase/DNA-(apurinic or apyrimidinic site) lyase [Paracoccaceae bacterium]|nr:bifunctional DNA-formamidopyrimidine glycosylase/DNA-(apurinic or apyrimidinic site) lyase [Paracoccaceae bacterium]MDE2675583.1 bifunctional DNA-formamidopyrimidine glycosylase/DNA-(apurinic or apyrimidinic site) lyase [Paracoccaceae bacterium]
MPELPEVETVRKGLQQYMEGQSIGKVEVFTSKLRWELPGSFEKNLSNQTITTIARRGKYLILEVSNGHCLIVHLGMTGSFAIFSTKGFPKYDNSRRDKHDHVVFHLRNGTVIAYNDPRKFGMMDLIPESELSIYPPLKTLGVEPLGNGFDEKYLKYHLDRRSSPVKNFLLDQKVIAGIGNIYASEALWRAGISPRRKANRISQKKAGLLVTAIRDVLNDAIKSGGSTLRNYRSVAGNLGYFQHQFCVYDQEGEPCSNENCDGQIHRIVQTGRSTFYCPSCQK